MFYRINGYKFKIKKKAAYEAAFTKTKNRYCFKTCSV